MLELLEVEAHITKLYDENAGIIPTFFHEEKDYSDYPIDIDDDGGGHMRSSYMMDVSKDVHRRYSGEGTDHIVMLIHEDNWTMDGIWGTNYSNIYSGYMMQICRWDKDNQANSIGTLYHEMHHSHDALIYTYLGIRIDSLAGVGDWDDDITHGGKFSGRHYPENWEYIRYKENTASLRKIGILLWKAYAKRQAIYDKKISMMEQIVGLAEKVIILSRQAISKKRV